MSDIDFFITDSGEIKIIDYQLHDNASYTSIEGILDGAEEIEYLFNLSGKEAPLVK